ncbi:hypothetical protein ABZP36_002501 [Zizania latifolia]
MIAIQTGFFLQIFRVALAPSRKRDGLFANVFSSSSGPVPLPLPPIHLRCEPVGRRRSSRLPMPSPPPPCYDGAASLSSSTSSASSRGAFISSQVRLMDGSYFFSNVP